MLLFLLLTSSVFLLPDGKNKGCLFMFLNVWKKNTFSIRILSVFPQLRHELYHILRLAPDNSCMPLYLYIWNQDSPYPIVFQSIKQLNLLSQERLEVSGGPNAERSLKRWD